MKKKLVSVLLLALASCSRPSPEFLYPIIENGKWGFIDSTGHVIIEPRYARVMEFRNHVSWVLGDSGWTLIDRRGHLVSGSFDSVIALPHPDDVRLTEDNRSMHFRPVWTIEYRHGGTYSYPMKKGGRWGLIDDHGRMVLPPHFEETGRWADGLAWYREGDRYGFLDSGGVVRIPAQFLRVSDFRDDRAWAATENGLGLIDRDGNWILPPKKSRVDASIFIRHHSIVQEVEMMPGPLWSPMPRAVTFWSKVDTTGMSVPFSPDLVPLAHGWSLHSAFKEDIGPADGVIHRTVTTFYKTNFEPVRLSDLYIGYRKLSNHLVLVSHYHDYRRWGTIRMFPDSLGQPSWNQYEAVVHPETEDVILVMKREWMHVTTREGQEYVPPMEIRHWGAMDSTGQWITHPEFAADSIWEFHGGLAKFSRGGKLGVVDRKLTERRKPEYDALEKLADNRWGFRKEEVAGLMDTDWQVIATGGWSELSPFRGDLAAFRSEKDSGYVDRQGRVRWVHKAIVP